MTLPDTFCKNCRNRAVPFKSVTAAWKPVYFGPLFTVTWCAPCTPDVKNTPLHFVRTCFESEWTTEQHQQINRWYAQWQSRDILGYIKSRGRSSTEMSQMDQMVNILVLAKICIRTVLYSNHAGIKEKLFQTRLKLLDIADPQGVHTLCIMLWWSLVLALRDCCGLFSSPLATEHWCYVLYASFFHMLLHWFSSK